LTTPCLDRQGFRLSRAGLPGSSATACGGPGMSDIAFAGIVRRTPDYGKTCRKNVLGRVYVPVVPGAAGRACPVPSGQAQFSNHVTARRAGLRTRVPAINHHQLPAVSLALVRELAAKLGPPAVGNRAGEPVVAAHAGDVEVFDGDEVVVPHHAHTDAMQKVASRVANLSVCPGDFCRCLPPIPAAPLTSSKTPLVTSQIPRLALKVTRVGHPLRTAGDGEVPDAKVHADSPPGIWQWQWPDHVDGEGDVPAAVALPADDYRRRVQHGHVVVWPCPHKPQRRGCLRQLQHATTQGKRTARIMCGLPAVTGLVPRIAGTPAEKRAERLVLVPQCLLQRDGRYLVQECQPRVFLHCRQRSIRLRVRSVLALQAPVGLPLRQCPVPHHTHTAERAVQYRLLLRIRICPASVRRPHSRIIAPFFGKTKEARRACLPSAPQRRRILPRPEGRRDISGRFR